MTSPTPTLSRACGHSSAGRTTDALAGDRGRGRPYAEAFTSVLDAAGLPWRATDVGRPARCGDVRLKSLDFVVRDRTGRNLLVELKGRRDPSSGGRRFENWVTAGDVTGLLDWERWLGPPAEAVLVFAYRLVGRPAGHVAAAVHAGETYAFYAVSPLDYVRVARRRSPRWDTLSVPSADFGAMLRPLPEVLTGGRPGRDRTADTPARPDGVV